MEPDPIPVSNPSSPELSDPEQWVELHGDYLFKYALMRLRDPAKAEDAVQETFLAALKGGKSFAGRSAEALSFFDRAMALDPHFNSIVLYFRAQALYQLGQYEEAVSLLKRRILRSPDTDASRVLLAACYGQMGRIDEAREAWREALVISPTYSLEQRRNVLPYKNPADFDRIVEGLRKAGLRET